LLVSILLLVLAGLSASIVDNALLTIPNAVLAVDNGCASFIKLSSTGIDIVVEIRTIFATTLVRDFISGWIDVDDSVLIANVVTVIISGE
jgi:hypothetical protein